MKKIIAFGIIVAMFLLIIGCAKMDPSVTSDESDHGENSNISENPYSPSIIGEHEFTLWHENIAYQDEEVPKEIQVTFDNVTYNGVYRGSNLLDYNYYPLHTYFDEVASIKTDPNGKIVYVNVWVENEPLLEKPLDQTQCEALAKEYLYATIEQPEDYVYRKTGHSSAGNYYIVYFTKYVDGWRTSDQVRIFVDPDTGKIQGFSLDMFGEFDVNEKVSFDRELIEEAVKARTEKLLSESDCIRFEYEQIDYILTKISATEYAVVSEIDLCRYYEDGSYMHKGIKYIVTE